MHFGFDLMETSDFRPKTETELKDRGETAAGRRWTRASWSRVDPKPSSELLLHTSLSGLLVVSWISWTQKHRKRSFDTSFLWGTWTWPPAETDVTSDPFILTATFSFDKPAVHTRLNTKTFTLSTCCRSSLLLVMKLSLIPPAPVTWAASASSSFLFLTQRITAPSSAFSLTSHRTFSSETFCSCVFKTSWIIRNQNHSEGLILKEQHVFYINSGSSAWKWFMLKPCFNEQPLV